MADEQRNTDDSTVYGENGAQDNANARASSDLWEHSQTTGAQDAAWREQQERYRRQIEEERRSREMWDAYHARQQAIWSSQNSMTQGDSPESVYESESESDGAYSAANASVKQDEYGYRRRNAYSETAGSYAADSSSDGTNDGDPGEEGAKKQKGRTKKRRFLRVTAAVLAVTLFSAAVFGGGYMIGTGTGLDDVGRIVGSFAQNLTGGGTSLSGEDGEYDGAGAASGATDSQASQDSDSQGSDSQGSSASDPRGQSSGRQIPALNRQLSPASPTLPIEADEAEAAAKAAAANAGANGGGAAAASGLLSLKQSEPTGDDLTVKQIYQKAYSSIVGIRVTFRRSGYQFGYFMMPSDMEQTGEGSGIIITADGYIMTNHHVITDTIDTATKKTYADSKIEVIIPDDENTYTASLVGYDQSTDLAVLKIDKNGLSAAELGNSDKVEPGDLAVAIGNPAGLEYMGSVTSGIISGLNRSLRTEQYENLRLIQTDAAINPGNSGGALINSKGQVIGVNSIKIASSQYEGLGFAIPINAAAQICDDLINYQFVKGRPYIGIAAWNDYTEAMADQYNMPRGVYVLEVSSDGPGIAAGLQRNDIIVKLNGKTINNFDELEDAKNGNKPGDKVTLQVYRGFSSNNLEGGRYVDLTLTLGEMTS